MTNELFINTLFTQAKPNNNYEEFKHLTIENIKKAFNMNTPINPKEKKAKQKETSRQLSLENFIENDDHGMEHAYKVYKKAMEIAQIVEKETDDIIRKEMIYPMVIAHDSARTITYAESDINKVQKEKRNDRNHERFGSWIFRTGMNNLIEKGMEKPSKEILDDIEDYLRNHDFLTEQLNGKRFHEPQSLEGQICRLADRISVSLKDEITRYWDTGKRLNTPFFNTEVPYKVRENLSFDNFGFYAQNGYIDEIMFFTSILMTKGDDFSHPTLARLYDEWAIQKKDAIDYIFEIANEEGASQVEKETLKELLKKLGKKYNFTVDT